MKIATFFILLIMTFGLNISQAAPRGAWSTLYEPNTYQEMPYKLMKPLNFDKTKKYPLIISLHGAGGRGSDNKKQLKDWNKQLAEKDIRQNYPAYVLAPQSKGHWGKEHLNKINDIIAKLPAVDMDRIYILGHSMGGHGTFTIIQLDTNYFAAAAPSAGAGLKSTEDFIDAKLIKDLPIWAFHGDKDKVCPYQKVKKVFEDIKALKGNMKLTTWHGGSHGVSGKFIPGDKDSTTELSSNRCDQETNFLTWLFKQKRNSK
jgi:predicted peptidase